MARTLEIDTDALLAALRSHDVCALVDARDIGPLYAVARRLADTPGAIPNLDEAEAFEGLSAEGFDHHEILAIESLLREMRRSGKAS